MDFDDWEPFYSRILEDFGFSRDRDRAAAGVLSGLLPPAGDAVTDSLWYIIRHLIYGKTVVVCGNGPNLERELVLFLAAHPQRRPGRGIVIIAADGATSVLLRHEVTPEIIVTDLDGCMEDIVSACHRGSIALVHAHGDNIDKLREYVPSLERVLGTTQAEPLDNVLNFGGFTDGDRAVFLADLLGALEILMLGFDFEDPSVTPRKSKKLAWARLLIDEIMDSRELEGRKTSFGHI